MPEPAEGEFLLRALWFSLDPQMRTLMAAPPLRPGGGGRRLDDRRAVAVVRASRYPGYAPGDHVVGFFGWSSHAVSDGSDLYRIDPQAAPLTAHLGVLGLPGHAAWISLNRIARAQPGETILISAASGAVGSVLGKRTVPAPPRSLGMMPASTTAPPPNAGAPTGVRPGAGGPCRAGVHPAEHPRSAVSARRAAKVAQGPRRRGGV